VKTRPTCCAENPQRNTENTPEITKKTTTENNVVVADLSIFPVEEHKAVQRFLAKISADEQTKVLEVMKFALKARCIRNRVGYLRALVTASLEKQLTQAEAEPEILNLEERLQRQSKKIQEEAEKDKVNNETFFANLQQRYGADKVFIPV